LGLGNPLAEPSQGSAEVPPFEQNYHHTLKRISGRPSRKAQGELQE